MNTPNDASDSQIARLLDHEPRHCKPATRYGREIVKREDGEIEFWPTAAAARDRLHVLERNGYTVAGTDRDAPKFAEIDGCRRVVMP